MGFGRAAPNPRGCESGSALQAILVVDSAEHREGHDLGAVGELVPMRLLFGGEAGCGFWEAGAEARVGARMVVVHLPSEQQPAQRRLAEWEEMVEALSAQGADQALTERVRLCARGGLRSTSTPRALMAWSSWAE